MKYIHKILICDLLAYFLLCLVVYYYYFIFLLGDKRGIVRVRGDEEVIWMAAFVLIAFFFLRGGGVSRQRCWWREWGQNGQNERWG